MADEEKNETTDNQKSSPSPQSEITWDILKAQIPAELQKEKAWDNIKDIPTLFKNYIEAQKYQGKSIKLPDKEASPDDVKSVRQKLIDHGILEAVPQSPDKYQITKPDIPENITWSEDAEKSFLKDAHALGLTNKQAQGVLNWYGGYLKSLMDITDRQFEETVTLFQKEWGGAYEDNMKLAQATVRQVFGPEVMRLLDVSGLGNHPALIRGFAKLGKQLKESDALLVGDEVQDEKSVQQTIQSILTDKTNPKYKAYWDDRDPNHRAVVQEVQRLFEVVYNPLNE